MHGQKNINFRKLESDKHINWKKSINKILPEQSSAYCVVRSVHCHSNMSTLKIIIVHSFMLEWNMALYFGVTR
jgi:hypothetical protein